VAVAGGTARPTSAASSVGTIATPRQPNGDARLFRKGHGQETRLAYLGHLLTENRYGLVVRVATPNCRAGGMGGGARHDGRPWAGIGSRSAATRAVTSKASPSGCARWGPRRTSSNTATSSKPAGAAAPPSTAAPTRHPGTRSVSAGANWSRKPSPGSRPSPVRRRPGSGNSSGRLVIPARGGRLQPNGKSGGKACVLSRVVIEWRRTDAGILRQPC
jgi:hypothetical protein